MTWNSVLVGIALGAFVPFVGYALLLELNDYIIAAHFAVGSHLFTGFSAQLLMALSICLNLLPFHYFKKVRYDDTMRGIVFPTLLFVGGWLLLRLDIIGTPKKGDWHLSYTKQDTSRYAIFTSGKTA